ncbi:S-adenosyl-L-methionine-dependent methyltransferase [Trema orientale]|uniref:tRNA:m(4)X modification enzyme TRM13 n=1 Tax=Trema orientale TaxID=63057 RepID=A0A2P5ET80_TREOI|nr:S-adenosyl-L-methionine-dependent methyltransferase [Trema orientale]
MKWPQPNKPSRRRTPKVQELLRVLESSEINPHRSSHFTLSFLPLRPLQLLASKKESILRQHPHPRFLKGINSGIEEGPEEDETKRPAKVGNLALADNNNSDSRFLDHVTSEMKRNAVHSMSLAEFCKLIEKIESVHESVCRDIRDSYKIPEACGIWIKREIDGKLPFQEKHVAQQASILGNLEEFGIVKSSIGSEKCDRDGSLGDDNVVPAVVEFGAGRGYLTQMLADCYGIEKVFLVERKSYKLKADRSLRQKERLILERLRIDIEDLNLSAVESLQGVPYLAIGKHLCGPATDLTLRCCLVEHCNQVNVAGSGVELNLRGVRYPFWLELTGCETFCRATDKKYFASLGITKEEFHAITWFTSWAVDADHGSDLSDVTNYSVRPQSIGTDFSGNNGVEDIIRNMKAVERAALGFKCKQIIDMGRMMWLREHGLETQFVKYVPPTISPENHLLIARCINHM